MEKYESVKVIEDKQGLIASGKVVIAPDNLLAGISNIQAIERWEDRLIDLGIPYVIAQVEGTDRCNFDPEQFRYKKGYGIFVSEDFLTSLLPSLERFYNDPDTLEFDAEEEEIEEDLFFYSKPKMGVV